METVQDIETLFLEKTNRKRYTAYQTAPFPMTLSVFQGQSVTLKDIHLGLLLVC